MVSGSFLVVFGKWRSLRVRVEPTQNRRKSEYSLLLFIVSISEPHETIFEVEKMRTTSATVGGKGREGVGFKIYGVNTSAVSFP